MFKDQALLLWSDLIMAPTAKVTMVFAGTG